MSRHRTAIRRRWEFRNGLVAEKLGPDWGQKPVLVIPDNPTARAAMVEKVYMMAHDHGSLSPLRALSRSHIEEILSTVLTP